MRSIIGVAARVLIALGLVWVPGGAQHQDARGGQARPAIANAEDAVSRIVAEVEPLEHQCFDDVNHERTARDIKALEWDDGLQEIARAYSRRMAEEGFFSHTDPDGNTVRDRARKAGVSWQMIGENLGYERGYISPVATVVTSWMESTGHRHNVLEPEFEQAAIGAWISTDGTVYFTEIFLKE